MSIEENLYDLNPEFNEIFDKLYGQVEFGNHKFSPAEVLFKLQEDVYDYELSYWKEEKKTST